METASSPVGETYGLLTVKEKAPVGWLCACACGNTAGVWLHQLRTGNNKSCGCASSRNKIAALNKTHGMSNGRVAGYKFRAYGIWQAMKDRCSNENRSDYHCYGGKGIVVCAEWAHSFEAFLADMGEPPAGLTLDRKDSAGNYEKSNCRWATRKEQAKNTSAAKFVTAGGVTKPLWQWFEEGAVKKCTYYARIRSGWSVEEAILGKAK